MKFKTLYTIALIATVLFSCKNDAKPADTMAVTEEQPITFDYNVEEFADIKILRYQIPGWDKLTLK